MMRERMFATLGIWAAVAIAIDRLLASLSYTISTFVQNTPIPGQDSFSIPQYDVETVFVSGEMQFATYVILFMLICAATGATIAIWEKARGDESNRQAAVTIRESHKAKRDRDMRVRRLLSTMDEDDLAALEEQHIGDDGEQMTVAELMANRHKHNG